MTITIVVWDHQCPCQRIETIVEMESRTPQGNIRKGFTETLEELLLAYPSTKDYKVEISKKWKGV